MINGFKTLDDFNFKGKTVLIRSDLNSDIKNGKVILSDRIRQSAKTISELKRKKAKIIILAHQGRPNKKDFTSLKQHSRLLSKFSKVKFVKDITGKKASIEISKLNPGEALLLENIRYLKEEFESKKNKLTSFFLDKVDIYINDSFSVSHRNQNSITIFPRHISKKGVGRVMEKEIASLKKITFKKCLYILGGAKTEDNLKLLKNDVIATGLFDHLCLIAKGYDLGKQKDFIREELRFLPKIKRRVAKIKTSSDFITKQKGKIINLQDLPINQRLYDIGPKTIQEIREEIRKNKFIFMKGPAGLAQKKEFSKGTVGILRSLAKHKGKVFLGGGHLNTTIEQYKINKKSFEHISLAGGALISYLSGEKLPGLQALKSK